MALWILIAVAGSILFSCAVGIVVGAVLGQIGRQVTELLELESWSTTPLTPRSR
jgi:NhaP-type Na+/H+ or K+/H+ antiporter